MKRRFKIINSLLAFAILASIFLQSFHSWQHAAEISARKICYHEHSSDFEITHQHHNTDHCFVCEFHFSNFISPVLFAYQLHYSHQEIPYFFTITNTPDRYSGSSCSLRGPPLFIV